VTIHVREKARGGRRGGPRCHVQPAHARAGRTGHPLSEITEGHLELEPAAFLGSRRGGTWRHGVRHNAPDQRLVRQYFGINVLILLGAVVAHMASAPELAPFRPGARRGRSFAQGQHGTLWSTADRFGPEEERRLAERTETSPMRFRS